MIIETNISETKYRLCRLSNYTLTYQRAKGVMIEFEHHDDLAISAIGSLVEELHTFIGTDPDIIFGTKENNALQKNMIDFRLIVTGIDKEISI